MAYISQIAVGKATGILKKIYNAAAARHGSVASIIQVMSLDEHSAKASMQLYTTLKKSPNELEPACREMLATVVSNANGCYY